MNKKNSLWKDEKDSDKNTRNPDLINSHFWISLLLIYEIA